MTGWGTEGSVGYGRSYPGGSPAERLQAQDEARSKWLTERCAEEKLRRDELQEAYLAGLPRPRTRANQPGVSQQPPDDENAPEGQGEAFP